MRLWHKSLISVLPRQQLVSQLRECVLIAKNIYEGKTKIHCLINPLFNYDICHFKAYIELVLLAFKERDYKVRKETIEKLNKYINFHDKICIYPSFDELFKEWHNEIYLIICYMNLLEKYKCGNIPKNEFDILDFFYLNIRDYNLYNKIKRNFELPDRDLYIKE